MIPLLYFTSYVMCYTLRVYLPYTALRYAALYGTTLHSLVTITFPVLSTWLQRAESRGRVLSGGVPSGFRRFLKVL